MNSMNRSEIIGMIENAEQCSLCQLGQVLQRVQGMVLL